MLKNLILIFLMLFNFNGFLLSETDITKHSRLLIFNKIGQKETVKIGENVSTVLGVGIKPEYTYLKYTAGKSPNEYIIELRSNEPLLKEISNLRTSLDNSKKDYLKLSEDINNPEQVLKAAEKEKKRDVSKIDVLQKKLDSLHELSFQIPENKTNFSIPGLNKDVSDMQALINDQDKKIKENKNLILLNNDSIHTIVKLINEINESGKNRDKLDFLRSEFKRLITLNSQILDQNKLLEQMSAYLNNELNGKKLELNRLKSFIWLVGITAFLFLILASVIYWNYHQKKKFSQSLSEINKKLENINLELKYSNTQLNTQNEEIQDQNKQLNKLNTEKESLLQIISNELQIASKYIISLIPNPITKGKITTDWIFIPSEALGGDAFGYNWIDAENFAIYLLDVSGHGVGPALHSVQVLNTLQNRTLPNVDFTKPNEVLNALNQIFQMNLYKDYYFTMWYGVYNIKLASLKYASAGHPPVIMVNKTEVIQLKTQNIFIGAVKNFIFEFDELILDKTSTLYLFSDGVYEIEKQDKEMYTVQEFQKQLIQNIEKKNQKLSSMYESAKSISCKSTLDDDFSILKIKIDK